MAQTFNFPTRRLVTTLWLIGLAITALPGCAPVLVAGAATGAYVAADRRTAGTIVDDKGIELKIGNKIASDKTISEKMHVNVTSYNKTVLLTGEVPSEPLRDQVVAWAGTVDGVKQVYNALDIANPTEYKSRNFDAWLTSKVKGHLVGKKEFDANHVKVVSENAVVYLMGLVNHAEADAIAQSASEVDGVKRVVKVFDYLD